MKLLRSRPSLIALLMVALLAFVPSMACACLDVEGADNGTTNGH